MLEAFIDRVGHGRVVTSEIVHSETWSALRESDVLEKAYARGKVWIRDKDRLMEFPIVRFLESSGMDIGSLIVEYGRKKRAPTFRALMHEIDARDWYTSF